MICDYVRQSIHVSTLKKNIISLRAIRCPIDLHTPLLSVSERQKHFPQVSRDMPTKRLKNHAPDHMHSSSIVTWNPQWNHIRLYAWIPACYSRSDYSCAPTGIKTNIHATYCHTAPCILTGTLSLRLPLSLLVLSIHKPIYYNRKLKHS